MLFDRLIAEVPGLTERLVSIRHDLHQHPELGFEEVRTQALVKDWLEASGYTPRVMAETGLVADLHPGAEGPCLALRADLDCLPMQERTELPYRSVHEGRAHKCGHDGHTAILMGAAAILAKHKDEIPGNVRLLFQPAEEGVRGGGAKVMVAEGALDGVREVYGLHNWPDFRKGDIRVQAGPMMAQVHELYLTITGVGGHGSQPQICRDPIVAGAYLVNALQTLVSRELGYEGGAVVSITKFQAGSTHNIIPGKAELAGTIRTFDPAVADRVLHRLDEIVKGAALSFGVQIEARAVPGYPVVMNEPGCAEAVARVGRALVGDARVGREGLPTAGGEDFAYMSNTVPGAYFMLGAGVPDEVTPMCHHPDFDFDDDLIPLGVKIFLGLVVDRLNEWR